MYEQTVIDRWQIEDERIHKCSSQFQLIFNYANSHRSASLWRTNFCRQKNVFCRLWCLTICAAPAEQKWKYMFLRRIPHGEKRNEFLLLLTFLLHTGATIATLLLIAHKLPIFFSLNTSSILLHDVGLCTTCLVICENVVQEKNVMPLLFQNEIWIFKLVLCLFVFVSNLLFGLVFLSFRWCFVKWIMIWV